MPRYTATALFCSSAKIFCVAPATVSKTLYLQRCEQATNGKHQKRNTVGALLIVTAETSSDFFLPKARHSVRFNISGAFEMMTGYGKVTDLRYPEQITEVMH